MSSNVALNHTVKDDIREYWGKRSETFDLSPGHEIFNEEERTGWHALFRRHLGAGQGRQVLDVASGTGVISLLLHDIGFSVTGIDFAEPMLARARDKIARKGAPIRFVLGDAEQTLEPDATYDALVNRHLVWTLVNPDVAFAEWFRVLKPGGRLLIVDADTPVPRTLKAAWLRAMARLVGRFQKGATGHVIDRATHDRIVSQVYFSQGAEADRIVALLSAAGFTDIVVDRDLTAIHRGQGRNMRLRQRLERASQDRFAIAARKPESPSLA
ncbi:class I SAM-dependent methyltransferase [Microvirga antarctica]|uniref:class I SAM-dependent methyltransferase n=1 Tax=Microvirga antarctica TaxID=2819233 RepID=UPI003CCE833C